MQFRLMGQTLALCHGKNDIAAFEKVMASTSAEQIDDPAPGSRIIEAFNFFVKNLDETKLDIMTIMTNTQFVKIDLDEDEDEQQIFDTINSLGVNLTTSELLKNYFFSRETIQEYEAKWVSVFEKDDDVKAYWDTELETGRLKRAMIDIFFDAYFQLFIQDRNYNITNEDKLMYARVDHLSQSYQHFINTYCGGNKNVVLDAMRDYALCFMNTFKLDQCERSVPSNFGVERINVVIFGLKNTTMIPYILFVAKNVSDDAEKNRIYGILESYIMRRMIVHASTKNYNNLFTSLILNQVLDADTLLARWRTLGMPRHTRLMTMNCGMDLKIPSWSISSQRGSFILLKARYAPPTVRLPYWDLTSTALNTSCPKSGEITGHPVLQMIWRDSGTPFF